LFLGAEIGNLGYGCVEIDESAMIGNSYAILWMFGIIDRMTKDARVFSVLNDTTKANLFPYIKKKF